MQSGAKPATLTAPPESSRALPEAGEEALLIGSEVRLVRHQFILSNFCSKCQGRELMIFLATTSTILSAKSPADLGRAALPALLRLRHASNKHFIYVSLQSACRAVAKMILTLGTPTRTGPRAVPGLGRDGTGRINRSRPAAHDPRVANDRGPARPGLSTPHRRPSLA